MDGSSFSSARTGGDVIAYILSGLVLLNFVPELIINVVFGTVGHTIIHVVKRK